MPKRQDDDEQLEDDEELEDESEEEDKDEEDEQEEEHDDRVRLRGGVFGEESGDDDEDDEELDPEEQRKIDKVVSKKLSKFEQQFAKQTAESELRDFLRENPSMKPYEGTIRKYADDPRFRHVPIAMIGTYVGRGRIVKDSAERTRKAEDKARKTQMNGTGRRVEQQADASKPESQNAWSLKDQDFAEIKRRALKGEFRDQALKQNQG